MNLSVTDWLIVLFVFCGMVYSVNTTKGLMKSVTDFLAAGRTAGRYVVSISSGIAGLGAISIMMFLEMGYVSGFALAYKSCSITRKKEIRKGLASSQAQQGDFDYLRNIKFHTWVGMRFSSALKIPVILREIFQAVTNFTLCTVIAWFRKMKRLFYPTPISEVISLVPFHSEIVTPLNFIRKKAKQKDCKSIEISLKIH